MNRKEGVNLFVLGAAKCGTTSLHHYLNQHPFILMAQPKEPLFFEAEYDQGNNFYLEKYFPDRKDQRILGESRHRNLYLPFVVSRIRAYAPDGAKFLIILRNPVMRAYSHWWHNLTWGDEKKSFEDAIEANIRRLETGPFFETEQEAELYRSSLNYETGYSPYESYLDSGFYADQIQRYIDAFGADRVKVLYLDDMRNDPQCEMKKVFQFIGIDHLQSIDYAIQNPAFSPIGKRVLTALRSMPGTDFFPKKIRSAAYRWIRKGFRAPNSYRSDLEPVFDSLLEIYEPHIRKLELMTDKVLSDWRNKLVI